MLEKDTAILDQLFEGAYLVDRERTILSWNRAAEDITGFSATDTVGRKCYDDLLVHVDEQGKRFCKGQCPLERSTKDGKSYEVAMFLRHKQGHRIPVQVRSIPLIDEQGVIQGAMEVFTRGGPAMKENQLADLARRAFIDADTGLLSREYIGNKLKSLLLLEVPGEKNTFGLVFIELENLRQLNDALGLAAGTEAIKLVARLLKETINAGDILARWAGGVFLVVTNFDRKSVLLNWASKIKAVVEKSQLKENQSSELRICIGGTIAKVGDDVAEAYRSLQEALTASRETSNGISIKG